MLSLLIYCRLVFIAFFFIALFLIPQVLQENSALAISTSTRESNLQEKLLGHQAQQEPTGQGGEEQLEGVLEEEGQEKTDEEDEDLDNIVLLQGSRHGVDAEDVLFVGRCNEDNVFMWEHKIQDVFLKYL